jgi:hypothetical protein
MISGEECPRCSSPMVRRVQRATGEPFLGCSRYPDCRGTRPLPEIPPSISPASRSKRQNRRRFRLSDGRRYARNVPDVVELLVARRIGRELGPWEGCVVQLLALVVFLAIVYWVFASGLFFAVTKPLIDWYVHQIHFGPVPTPTPVPS